MFTDREFVLLMRLILRRKIPKVLVNMVLQFANPVYQDIMQQCQKSITRFADWRFLILTESILYSPEPGNFTYPWLDPAVVNRRRRISFLFGIGMEGHCRRFYEPDHF